MSTETTMDAEEAYKVERAGRELFGKELSAYSPARKVAANSMGILYPLIGDEGVEALNRSGVYPGMMKDVGIMCWLCTLPDASPDMRAWTPTRASRKPEAAYDAMMEWLGDNGMSDINSPNFIEAMKVFLSIINAEAASAFVVSVEGAAGGEEGSGPNV